MDRVAACLGLFALAAALGTLAACELVLVPGLRASDLIDANQATSLAAPLHLRSAEIVAAATVLLALSIPRWLGSRVATTLALLAVGCAALHRFVALPAMYGAWSRVDLVAGRPLDRLADAREIAERSHWLALLLAVVLVGCAVVLAWRSLPPRTQPADVPTNESAPQVA